MSNDEVEDAARDVVASGEPHGIDPAFRDLLVRVANGELTVDEAMKIARKGNRNG